MIQNFGVLLATLDCVVSLASVAVSAPVPYCRPKILPRGSGVLELVDCRHPCLEMEDHVSFIPNDCRMGQGLFSYSTSLEYISGTQDTSYLLGLRLE